MFKELLSDFDAMSISDKREEINNEFLYLYLLYEKLCATRGIQYRKVIDEEIKELIDNAETEDEYLDGVYAYIEAIKEMMGSLLEQG
jgi:hypothetical protein